MRILFSHGIKLCAVLAVLLLIAAGCSSSGGETGTTPVVPTGSDPAVVTLSATPGTISAGGTVTVTARVTDEDSAIVVGATVDFSADSLYGTITATADTDASGVATATFTSSGQTGTATITASVGSSVTGSTTVIITPVAAYLSLSTSQTSILTDGVDAADITATVLNASRVPIEGIAVNFSVAAGQLSASNVMTDGSGQAETSLTSGTYDKTNQVVTVTVTAQDLIATIPIRVTGTTVSLSINDTSLASGGTDDTSLTVTVRDGGGTEISGADVTLTQSGSGTVTLNPASGTTGVDGTLNVEVTGQNAGNVTITATALGATKTQAVAVEGLPFEIISPVASLVSQATGSTLDVTVRSPNGNDVKFVTSMGLWSDDPSTSTITVSPDAGGLSTATLNVGSSAGTATVRVEDFTDSTINDTLLVSIYAGPAQAAKLTLQAEPTTILPSTENTTNVATIRATVKSNTDSPVGDAPVMFTLFRTTGGGEYVTPPITYTESTGQGEAEFVSGSLTSDSRGVFCLGRIAGAGVAGPANVFSFVDSDPDTITRSSGDFTKDGFPATPFNIRVSGSDSNDKVYTVTTVAEGTLTLDAGNELTAEVAGPTLVIATAQNTAVQRIVISGQACSVSIGGATVVEEYDPATYRYPMSVLVTDANGSGVPDTDVTLSVWPLKYSTGYTTEDGPVRTADFWNEDLNRNNNLDDGEDTNGPEPPRPAGGHPDGVILVYDEGYGPEETAGNDDLDPDKSYAGLVPVTVRTNDDGVAQFYHIYQKNSAGWIKVEYRATTIVSGSETVSTLNAWLGWMESEASNIPSSPWGETPWSYYLP